MQYSKNNIFISIKEDNNSISLSKGYIVGNKDISIKISVKPFLPNTSALLYFVINNNEPQAITGIKQTQELWKNEGIFNFKLPDLPHRGILKLALTIYSGGKQLKTCNDPSLKKGAWELNIIRNEDIIDAGYILESGRERWDDNILGGYVLPVEEQISEDFNDDKVDNAPRNLPAFLLPFQIETRIVDNFLKIRIYPDQISIDSLERRITKQEFDDANNFIESEYSKDVWNELVTKYKPLRAAWISKLVKENGDVIDIIEESSLINPKVAVLPDFFIASLELNDGRIIRKRGTNITSNYLEVITFPEENEEIPYNEKKEGSLFRKKSKWVEDYNEAFNQGMAITIPLDEIRTIDKKTIPRVTKIKKIVVYGLRSVKPEITGKQVLSNLFESHQYTKGIGFLQHGTDTNNTQDDSAGFSSLKDTEKIYEREFLHNEGEINQIGYQNSISLAKSLGLNPNLMKKWENPSNTTFTIIDNFHEAIWYPTGSFYLEKVFGNDMTRETKNRIKNQFVKYVRPMGYLPSFRIGKYPYGVLPVSELERTPRPFLPNKNSETQQDSQELFDYNFVNILNKLSIKWLASANSEKVPKVMNQSQQTSAEEELCKILSVLPQSLHYTIDRLLHKDGRYWLDFSDLPYHDDMIEKWKQKYEKLKEFLYYLTGKEYRNLPEWIETIRFTSSTDHPPLVFDPNDKSIQPQQYLNHLLNSNATIHDFNFLLYKLLFLAKDKYGVIFNPNTPFEIFTRELKRIEDLELKVETIKSENRAVSSKKQFKELVGALHFDEPLKSNAKKRLVEGFYTVEERLGSIQDQIIVSTQELKWNSFVTNLASQINNFDVETLFMSIIDTFSYRLDAWISSVANKRLDTLRSVSISQSNTEEGILIGYYGFVENLDLSVAAREAPKGGFTHAFSHTQASTAAILKNAYLDYSGNGENPYRINISSDRIRRALAILQGKREGQELGALLGYQFERYLHDHNLDQYIDEFREAYPLEVNTVEGEVKSRMVTNGYDLAMSKLIPNTIEIEAPLKGKPGIGYNIFTDKQKVTDDEQALGEELKKAIKILCDTLDAISDLLIHESVYQCVKGNYERSSASMDIASGQPGVIEPESVSVNLSRIISENRICLMLDAKNHPVIENPNLLEIAEPVLASWFADILGNLNNIGCCVQLYIKENNESITEIRDTVLLNELSLKPIDFLYLCAQKPGGGSTELETKIKLIARMKYPNFVSEQDETVIEEDKKRITINFGSFETNAHRPDETNAIPYSVSMENAIELAYKTLATLGKYSYLTPEHLFKQKQLIAGEEPEENDTQQPPEFDYEELNARLLKCKNYGKEQFNAFGDVSNKSTFELLSDISEGCKYQAKYYEIIDNLDVIILNIAKFQTSEENFKEYIVSTLVGDINAICKAKEETLNIIINNLNTFFSDKVLADISELILFKNQIVEIVNTWLIIIYKEEIGSFEGFCKDYLSAKSVNVTDLISFFNNQNKILMQPCITILNGYGSHFDLTEQVTYHTVKSIFKSFNERYEDFRILELKLNALWMEKNSNHTQEFNESEFAKRITEILIACFKALFGNGFIILPKLIIKEEAPLNQALNHQETILKGNSLERIQLWMQQVAQTHKEVDAFEELIMFLDAWTGYDQDKNLKPYIANFPYSTEDGFIPWQALDNDELKIEDNSKRENHTLGVCVYTNNFQENLNSVCGFMIDQWFEDIPLNKVNTAVTFEADTPNQQPPNCCLLAVPGEKSNDPNWNMFELENIISETLDLTKIRAVDMESYPNVAGLFPAIYTEYENIVKTENSNSNGPYQ
ncbi:MAG: hypothetical protein P1P88_01025 [Bacteroidales bacterium]|nr:hypothetical protein [Bacteroidales bacterium]